METTKARVSADMELREEIAEVCRYILFDGMDKLESCSHFSSAPFSGRWREWEAHTYDFGGSSS